MEINKMRAVVNECKKKTNFQRKYKFENKLIEQTT